MIERDIINQFAIEGKLREVACFGGGHINDSYLASFESDGSRKRYVLQRINRNVFKDPLAVMDNMVRVTNHIRQKLMDSGVSDLDRRVLTIIPANNGKNYVRDKAGDIWRVTRYISCSKTYDIPEITEQIFQAAKAFGLFQQQLADLPGPPLKETIEGFHDSRRILENFLAALRMDTVRRVVDCEDEINFILDHRFIVEEIDKLIRSGSLPVRNTHNDTKVNNVLIDDKTGDGICVIDLDTVMPRSSVFDFGDLVRTVGTTAAEDERDLSKVNLEFERYEAVLGGFLQGTQGMLTAMEIDSLFLGAVVIVYDQAVRFLCDFLNGDIYYKVKTEDHNLFRARTQIKLLQCLMESRALLERMATGRS